MKAIETDLQDAQGYDLELIRTAMSQSLEERLDWHRRAAESVLWLLKAGALIRSGQAEPGD